MAPVQGVRVEFRCAFINCNNLFSPGVSTGRSKLNAAAIVKKIANLADTLKESVGGQSPDLIGLCEVGDEGISVQLGDALGARDYKSIWSGPPPRKDTGLIIFYKSQLFDFKRQWIGNKQKGKDQRVRSMAALLQCKEGLKEHLWFIVNHWEADYSNESAPNDRMVSWVNLTDFFHKEAKAPADSIIIIGDFNCEPGDAPLVKHSGTTLESTRERELVLSERTKGSYLYNLMWRHMGEVDPYDKAQSKSYRSSRPVGTYLPKNRSTGRKMVDQILITKPLLNGPSFQIIESSLRITQPCGKCSDHCAVGATFQILQEA